MAIKTTQHSTNDSHEARVHMYWQRNLKLIGKLLCIWFIVSLGCGILWVDWLNTIQVGGYKLGFWFAQQGAIYTFALLILYYSRKMAALDKEFGLEDRECKISARLFRQPK